MIFKKHTFVKKNNAKLSFAYPLKIVMDMEVLFPE